MNIFLLSIFPAIIIWSIFFETYLFIIFLVIILLYIIPNLFKSKQINIQEKFLVSNHIKSKDSKLFFKIQVDFSKIDKFLNIYNKKHPLKRLTYSHLALKSVGEGLKTIKSGYYNFGNLYINKNINSSLIVNIENKDIACLIIKNSGKNNLREIAKQMKGKVGKIKNSKKNSKKKKKGIYHFLPSYIIDIIFAIVNFITYDLGLPFFLFKMNKQHFGSCLITNLSTFNVHDITTPHGNLAKFVLILAICQPKFKLYAENGKIVEKKICNINVIYDIKSANLHSILTSVDKIKNVWKNPGKYL